MKEFKISLLTHKYEVFKIDNDETITLMYDRFNNKLYVPKGWEGQRKDGAQEEIIVICA